MRSTEWINASRWQLTGFEILINWISNSISFVSRLSRTSPASDLTFRFNLELGSDLGFLHPRIALNEYFSFCSYVKKTSATVVKFSKDCFPQTTL
jgi:hypothetical protein